MNPEPPDRPEPYEDQIQCRWCGKDIEDHPDDHPPHCPAHPACCMVCCPPPDAVERFRRDDLDLVFCDTHDIEHLKDKIRQQEQVSERDTDMIIPERDS